MKLFIKNMVCNRCIKVVREEMIKLGFSIVDISLGEVKIKEIPSQNDIRTIKKILIKNGFDLIEDRTAKIIEDIKKVIVEYVHHSDKDLDLNLSKLIEDNFSKDYSYLSTLFSSKENITIEQYYIFQKIEKAKELLKYGDFTLSEIAFKLGYKSVNHLSAQFKKVTGMTATEFKLNTSIKRNPIDKIK
jgi:AraC-like DNA-binding protein